jgi:glutamine amidotransferase-like uncharacterized protein
VTSTENSQDVEIVARFVDREILQSGWLLGEQVIARKAAAVSVKHGNSRVVLIGFRPQHAIKPTAFSSYSTRSSARAGAGRNVSQQIASRCLGGHQ